MESVKNAGISWYLASGRKRVAVGEVLTANPRDMQTIISLGAENLKSSNVLTSSYSGRDLGLVISVSLIQPLLMADGSSKNFVMLKKLKNQNLTGSGHPGATRGGSSRSLVTISMPGDQKKDQLTK
jgi:hypothetical protein